MKEANLKLAQKEIDDALEAVDEIVTILDSNKKKKVVKKNFFC